MDERKMLEYEAPQVITYTAEEILEELGPAQAIYGDTPVVVK
ncbi:MAG: hypothetical protein PVI59_15610 [Anaerolineae bacterium]|jgi:hypothetical protein